MTIIVDASTFQFSVNRDDVIRLAMTDCGALGVGEDMAPEDVDYCADKLNMLVKQWQGSGDFAPGLKMWARKRADLFLQVNKSVYELGPSGDHWAQSADWHSTTLAVAANAAAGTITVSSAVGIQNGLVIGVLLNNGQSHWTTVNSAPVGSVVTLSGVMPTGARAGKTVYFYSANAVRPLQLLSVNARDANNQEIPLLPMNLEDYEALPAKADSLTTGTPSRYYYESQLSEGLLFLDRFPADATSYPLLHVVYLSPIQDLILSTDTPDYPQQWYRALAAQLAMDIAPGFQLPATKELAALRNDAVMTARNFDPDTTALYFQPGADDYTSGRSW